MDFGKIRKEQSGIQSLGDLRRAGKIKTGFDPKKAIRGPKYFDCLQRPWLRGDLLGVLSPTGVGKTTWSLFTIKEVLKNNPQGGVAVLVVLEQSTDEINEKWEAMTEDCPELADRLYIFSNYDDQGMSQNLGISEIKYNIKKIKNTLNETVLVFLIDHLHLINNQGSENFNAVCVDLKALAKEVDAYGIIISQTTKANQVIDVPVPRTGCYNCSQYEWIMTNIISIFQPLKRVEHEANLPLLGWQLSKIRYKGATDKVKEQMNYLLYFDHNTQSLRELTRQEKADFEMYYEKVLELRQNEEKFKSFQFDISETITGKDGKTVKLDKVIGGKKLEDDF